MSHTSDVISFDLFSAPHHDIDVTGFFPVSSVHAIDARKKYIDTVASGEGKTYDFSLSNTLSLTRFRTIETLDLARPEFFAPSFLRTYILDIKPRIHTIDLCPRLEIPYGALDIRTLSPIFSSVKYADIFARNLPLRFHMKWIQKQVGKKLSKHRRSIIYSLATILLTAFPILFYTKFLVETSYASLLSLGKTSSLNEVVEKIDTARSGFERAHILFFPFSWIPNDTIRLADIAIDGGLSLTRGITSITDTLEPSIVVDNNTGTVESGSENALNYRGVARDFIVGESIGIDSPTDWLEKNMDRIALLSQQLRSAGGVYTRAETIENPRSSDIVHIGKTLEKLSKYLDFYEQNESSILMMLGHDEPERYLILNQNRDELRANGGFPGSVITFTLYKGNILDYRSDDVYYYDWNLYPYKEVPPPGLALLSNNYGLRDVNYYPDFRETLEKANDFIERSGDATITTGIAIHQGVVENILEKIGPVTLSWVSTPFTSENFSVLMSTLVEARHGQEITAKDSLFRFIRAFVQRIHETRSYDTVLDVLERSVRDGEILFASRNESIDSFLAQYRKKNPWEISGISQKNWIYPVITSVSGNKSDRFITRKYTADTTVLPNCIYENKITLSHKHVYTAQDESMVRGYLDLIGITDKTTREKMTFIQGKGKNRAFIRLFVPPGSVLTGSTVWVESIITDTATEFSFFLDTDVGTESSKTLRYITQIPECNTSSSGVEWYRQPGIRDILFRSK